MKIPAWYVLLLCASLALLASCDEAVFDPATIAIDESYSVRSASVSIDSPGSPYYISRERTSVNVAGGCSGVVDQGQQLFVFLSISGMTKNMLCRNGEYSGVFDLGDLEEGAYALSARVQALSRTDYADASIDVIVDRTPPELEENALILPAERMYSTGNAIDFFLDFNEDVVFEGLNRPKFTLRLIDASGDDAALRTADYLSLSQDRMGFRYLVQEGDDGKRGIKLSQLDLFGSVLTDVAGNHIASADWGITSYLPITADQVVVDTTLLTIESVTSIVLQPTEFVIGERVIFEVKANKPIFLNNLSEYISPRLLLRIGSVIKYARYYSTVGTDSINFNYEVVQGDFDPDGVEVIAFESNGTSITDSSGVRLLTKLPVSGDDASIWFENVRINGQLPEIDSITTNGSSYKKGDTIRFDLAYSKDVVVTGDPTLRFGYGSTADREATYSGASPDGRVQYFSYAIADGEETAKLIVPNDPIRLDANDSIVDAITNNSANNAFGLTSFNVVLDAKAPTIVEVYTNKPGEVLKLGETLIFTLSLNEAVRIDLSGDTRPELSMGIGNSSQSETKYLQLQQLDGQTTSSLTFAYEVEEGVQDDDGVLLYNTIAFNGASFSDAVGNRLGGELSSWSASYDQKVDAKVARITDITHPANGTYSLASGKNRLLVDIVFDEGVIYTDNGDNQRDLYLEVEIGNDRYRAGYAGAPAPDADGYASTQRFAYTLEEDLLDTEGIRLVNLWFQSYQGADRFTDKNGIDSLPVARDGGSAIALPNVVVDSVRPRITQVGYALPTEGRGAFGVMGDTNLVLSFLVDSDVTVRGSSLSFPFRKGVDDTSSLAYAPFSRLNGSRTLVFSYSVSNQDNDEDGIQPGRTDADVGIDLQQSTVVDAQGNPLVIADLASVQGMASLEQILIDNTAPFITGIGIPQSAKGATLYLGDELVVEAGVSEPVRFTNGDTIAHITLPLILGSGAGSKISLQLEEAGFAGNLPDDVLIFKASLPADIHTSSIQLDPSFDAIQFPAADRLWDKANNDLSGDYTSANIDLTGLAIRTTRPKINQLSIQGISGQVDGDGNKYFKQGEDIVIRLGWTEKVRVTGTPRIPIRFSHLGTPRYADYSGDGDLGFSTSFVYRVDVSDNAPGGVYLGQSNNNIYIEPQGGSIMSEGNQDANLNLATFLADGQGDHLPDVIIDNIPPEFIDAVLPQQSTYVEGETFVFDLQASEEVRYLPQSGQDPRGVIRVYTSTSDFVRAAYSMDQTADDDALTYAYTLASGVDTPRLDRLEFSVMELQTTGDSIRDWAGNAVAANYSYTILQGNDIAFNTLGPAVSSVVLPAPGRVFKLGDRVSIAVNFDENIVATPGRLFIQARIGSNVSPTVYPFERDPSMDGARRLVFTWTVPSGVADSDGIRLGTSSAIPVIHRSNGATITDEDGVESSYSLFSDYSFDSIIDGDAPRLASIVLPADGNYSLGDTLRFKLVFDQPVSYTDVINSPAAPALQINQSLSVALNHSTESSDDNTLIFTRTITSQAESDTGFGLLPGSLFTGSSRIEDESGNLYHNSDNFADLVSLLDYAGIVIDAKPPALSSVVYSSDKQGGSAKTGDKLLLRLNFDEQITVNAAARIAFGLGENNNNRFFSYDAGSSSAASLVFIYQVQNGDTDLDGIFLDTLLGDNATIKDQADNLTTEDLTTPANSASIPVNASEPVITDIFFDHDLADFVTDTLRIGVRFNKQVLMSPAAGSLSMVFRPAGTGQSSRMATASFNQPATEIFFTYDLGDIYTESGISFVLDEIRLDQTNTRLFSAVDPSDDALRGFSSLLESGSQLQTDLQQIKLSNITPRIEAIDSNFTDQGVPREFVTEGLKLTVSFSTPVTINNQFNADLAASVRIPFLLDGAQRYFSYDLSVDNPDDMTFGFIYTPQYGDVDLDGISFGLLGDSTPQVIFANSVTLEGKYDGRPIDRRLSNAADFAQITANLPTVNYPLVRVTGVSVLHQDPATERVFVSDESMIFRVAFSDDVSYDTPPLLGLQIGGDRVDMSADAVQPNANTIDFTYTVKAGDSDSDGIATASNNALAGNLRGMRGNSIDDSQRIAANGLAFAYLRVDGVAPTVTAVVVAEGDFKEGDDIDIQVNFSEEIAMSGNISYRLLLQNAGQTNPVTRLLENATLTDNTTGVAFVYRVQSGINDDNGVRLEQLLGDITDVNGNAANVSGANRDFPQTRIDTIAPVIRASALVDASDQPLSAPVYGENARIYVLLDFSEKVKVATNSRIAIAVGDTTRDFLLDATTDTSARFSYVVQSGDSGDNLLADSITGSITDAAGNQLDIGNLIFNPQVTISTETVNLTAFLLPDGAAYGYALNESVQLIADFNTDVTADASVKLLLQVGGEDVTADLVGVTSEGDLLFGFTALAGLNGSVMLQNITNPGNITAVAGQAYAGGDLGAFNLLAPVNALLIDTTAPRILGVAASDGYYLANETITFTLTFSEPIGVDTQGLEQLTYQLDIDGENRIPLTTSDTSGSTLDFDYTVTAGQTDRDGVELGDLREFSYIVDAVGNQLAADTTTDYSLAEVRIDSLAPSIDSLDLVDASGAVTSKQVYQNRDRLHIRLTFSEDLVFSSPGAQLLLESTQPDSSVDLIYLPGLQSSNALVFGYDVSVDEMYDNLRLGKLTGNFVDVAGNAYPLVNAPRPVSGIILADNALSVVSANPNTLTAGQPAPSDWSMSGTRLDTLFSVVYSDGTNDTTCTIGVKNEGRVTGIDCSNAVNPPASGAASLKVQDDQGNVFTYTGLSVVAPPALAGTTSPTPTRGAAAFPSSWIIDGSNLGDVSGVSVAGADCDSIGSAAADQRTGVDCSNAGAVANATSVVLGVVMPDGYEATTDIDLNPAPVIGSVTPDTLVHGMPVPADWVISGAHLDNVDAVSLFIDGSSDVTTDCFAFHIDSPDRITADCSNAQNPAAGDRMTLRVVNPDGYTTGSEVIEVLLFNLPLFADASVDAIYGDSFNNTQGCTASGTVPSGHVELGTANLLEVSTDGDVTADNGPGATIIRATCPATATLAEATADYEVYVSKAVPTLDFDLSEDATGNKVRYLGYDQTDNGAGVAGLGDLVLSDTADTVLNPTSGGASGSGSITYSLGGSAAGVAVDANTGVITLTGGAALVDRSVDIIATFTSGAGGAGSYYEDASSSYRLEIIEHRPAAAYSLRKLLPDAGAALQVRRSTDDATRDIGFDASGDLDTTALLTFVKELDPSADGRVAVWYDQSGYGVDLLQASADRQPSIVLAGALVEENGRPSIDFTGATGSVIGGEAQWLNSSNSLPSSSANIFVYLVHRKTSLANAPFTFGLNYLSGPQRVSGLIGWSTGTILWDAEGDANRLETSGTTYNNVTTMHQYTFAKTNTANGQRIRRNGAGIASRTSAASLVLSQVSIGRLHIAGVTTNPLQIRLSEMLVYLRNDFIDGAMAAAEADQKAYWGTP